MKMEPKMTVGFTGTRDGLTEEQKTALTAVLDGFEDFDFYHGSCLGADYQAHQIALTRATSITALPGHGVNGESPLYFKAEGARIEDPLPYLQRNRRIVDLTEVLIACPESDEERLRSGTWSTVRYARRKSKTLIMIYPSGATTFHVNQPIQEIS